MSRKIYKGSIVNDHYHFLPINSMNGVFYMGFENFFRGDFGVIKLSVGTFRT
jgi:hypothetical protein